jgi:signal transduction histidine kinase/ActR/RegA family two-component response regulator
LPWPTPVEARQEAEITQHDLTLDSSGQNPGLHRSEPDLSTRHHAETGWTVALISGFSVMAVVLFHIGGLIKKVGHSNRRLRTEIDKRRTMANVLRKSEARLVNALKEVHAANDIKNQFLANINHEIRTPTNGIVGITGLLMGTEMTEEQQDYVNTIHASTQSLLRIINDILDYANIESGKLNLQTVEFELPAVIANLIETVSARFKEKGLAFGHLLDRSVPTHFTGDAGRLHQILGHLLDNAAKFTPNGNVFLHISVQQENDIYAVVRFCIKDTGIGIDTARIDRLFGSFTQADISHTRQYGGTGLGLAISRYLVAKMGGDIGVVSSPGQGSEFWFTVKLKKQAGPGQCKPAIAQDGDAYHTLPDQTTAFDTQTCSTAEKNAPRILIVEDNVINQKVTVKILDKHGCKSEVAANGRKALEAMRCNTYDVVLMDLQMPEMDGFEATKTIRDPSGGCLSPHVPIIALTANAQEETRHKCLNAGMDDFLAKPVSPNVLMGKIRQWIQKFGENKPCNGLKKYA